MQMILIIQTLTTVVEMVFMDTHQGVILLEEVLQTLGIEALEVEVNR